MFYILTAFLQVPGCQPITECMLVVMVFVYAIVLAYFVICINKNADDECGIEHNELQRVTKDPQTACDSRYMGFNSPGTFGK